MSNILPKKTWHVGRPENIQRVQEDEEKAQAAKELLDAKQDDLVRRKRLELLRKSATSSSSPLPTDPKGHINLFKDEDDFQKTLFSRETVVSLRLIVLNIGI